MQSNYEIQVFKNIRPPVSEELILFNDFSKSFSDECTDFLIFSQDHFKDFSNYKIPLKCRSQTTKFKFLRI